MKKMLYGFMLFMFVFVIVGCSSGQSTLSSVSKANKEPRDFRNGGDITAIKHGDSIIVSGQVILGSGKKSGRDIASDFGSFDSVPITIQDKNGNEWKAVLYDPVEKSLIDKTITIKGVADTKTTDPAIDSRNNARGPKAAIVKAEIIK
ncbi:MAG: hypothetical protein H6Q72_1414 [Firmicutes bacterium]|nr:hypothetical protein [Bacillota bacterium]